MTAPDCPHPAGCTVPDPPGGIDADDLRLVEVAGGVTVCRSYQLKFGYDAFNPGHGDTRFAPTLTTEGGAVPTMYGGVDDTAVLLETVFHDIHHSVDDRLIYEAVVRNWALAFVRLPRQLTLIDLRDDALDVLGLSRRQLVTSTAEHYPCTRHWATWLHNTTVRGQQADGLIWHSRQAELHQPEIRREVFILWGDRAPNHPGDYPLTGPGVRSLSEGPGRVLLDQLAETLNATIIPSTF